MTKAIRRHSGLLRPAWTLLLPLVALTALLAAPPERRLYATLASALVFTAMQFLIPNCRFRTGNFLSPVNIGSALFLVQIVVTPILVMVLGATNNLFIAMPSRESMEGALAIDAAAYVAFCLGLALAARNRGDAASPLSMTALSMSPLSMSPLSMTPGPALI